MTTQQQPTPKDRAAQLVRIIRRLGDALTLAEQVQLNEAARLLESL